MSGFRFDDLARKLLLLNHDEFAVASIEALVTAEKAEAWDAGFTRGFYDVLAGDPMRDASESRAANPFREQVTS